jgi:inositol 3-alpha-galactosyltransferase
MGENIFSNSDRLPKVAWVTLITRESYLPGATLLAYSLKRHLSKYPLVILTTPGFQKSYIPTLQQECSLTNSRHIQISALLPPAHHLPETLIAPRFEDTWTKLQVFELYKYGCEKLVFLDADMLVRRNMDELFDLELPGRDWIAANHACVCNLDHDSWAPDD